MSNILLIEDNEAIIMGLEYLFTNNGYNVRVARSAYQAKEILDNAKETEKYRALIGAGDVWNIDIVILDVMLPDGDGFSLCRKIKADDIAPVIFLTAKDEEKDVVMGLELGADDYVIKNISFKANRGETIAFIGATGEGKSTLINLIPRFYDTTEGEVLVDGVNVRDMNQQELRSKIGYVPQKAMLFTGTIRDNILYGKEDATDEEVRHALDIAQATDFVSKMKEGIESPISQGGTNVSGGQKQRLSIARAIVRKPEIYLFDDSFSALDFKTDAQLRAALKKETKDSTVIIVAQRVSTVMDATRILVMDEGHVVGMGTHEELLQTNEIYQQIVESQLKKGEEE